jgi:hypothetical protein
MASLFSVSTLLKKGTIFIFPANNSSFFVNHVILFPEIKKLPSLSLILSNPTTP